MHWMSDLRGILAMPIKGSASMNRLVLHEMSSRRIHNKQFIRKCYRICTKNKTEIQIVSAYSNTMFIRVCKACLLVFNVKRK